jgi:hypothetical protein
VLVALAFAANADVVQTRGARLTGTVALAPGVVVVGKARVAWDDVLTLVREDTATRLPAPHAVRSVSGERWAVDILALSAGKLKVFFPPVGTRELPLDLVQAIEFLPDLPERADLKLNTLYREKGEPVPGSLLWIDTERLAIDSPLGALRLKRTGLARYVFRKASPPAGRSDEVHLGDGSLLRGAISPAANGVTLEHDVLGKLTLRTASLRAVLRRPSGVQYLADTSPRRVETTPLIALSPPAPEVQRLPRGGELCLNGIAVQPKTVLHYPVPRGARAMFRSVVGPVAGSRGGVKIRIAAGGKDLLERELPPDAAWEPVALDVPGNGDLVVEIDFAQHIQFPCGAVLGDPHLVTSK